ncbi:MAG TPA: ATP synthase F1 subunit delta [Nitrospirae bacterium]|nr:ATP synthase subunit delta [bacterium BMS3Abin06]HDH12980.1 ATP synthase F1 subunit delta [Nitrospirota bacterium]HDZ02959.1 ATP synthase F1 subunit delta [Nitrospirota bacterium]
MNKNQIAKKYSRAIINSVEISEIPKVIQEFKAFSRLLDANRQLQLLFAGQIFSEDEKEKAFNALKPLLKFNAATGKFLKLIIVHGHLSALKEIIAASIDVYNERQKKATALVVSSVKLDKKYTERLKSALKQMTNREITVENQIDESLLGGFIVKVGSTIFDSSVKGQLRLLRAELMR